MFTNRPNVEVSFHSDQYVTNNTADFVFIYDKKNEKYTVYPMAEISSITSGNVSVPKYLNNEPVKFGKFWDWLFKPRNWDI